MSAGIISRYANGVFLGVVLSLTVFVTLPLLRPTPTFGTFAVALARQQQEWGNLERGLLRIADSCGSLTTDNATVRDLQDFFLNYKHNTETFLSTVNEIVPQSLRSNSCSDFQTNSQLAVLQANSISDSLLLFQCRIPDDLIAPEKRIKIVHKAFTASSVFIHHTRELLEALWHNWPRSIPGLWQFNTSGEQPRRIHTDYGVDMLVARRCSFDVEGMDKTVKRLHHSFGESLGLLRAFVAESISSAKAWEQLQEAEVGQCTQRQLDAMNQHYARIRRTALSESSSTLP